jgi:hypothetical protein
MPWGARPNAALIMRNQLPSRWFDRAIQRVRTPGTEREVMGAYLPRGRYTSTGAFERRAGYSRCERSTEARNTDVGSAA